MQENYTIYKINPTLSNAIYQINDNHTDILTKINLIK